MGDQTLTDFQREVANVLFALPESGGELTVRPTQDLDLFTHAPVESIDAARDALIVAATDRGWTTTPGFAPRWDRDPCRLSAGLP